MTMNTSRTRRHPVPIILVALAASFGAYAQDPSISVSELRDHIRYLASDELQGRAVGSPGEVMAGDYIAADFRRSGLQPLGDNGTFFQSFEFVAGVELGRENSASVTLDGSTRQLSLGGEFRPAGFSSSGSWSGGMVFAG